MNGWLRRALRSVDDPQGGHADHNNERPLSLSSEPQLRFGLCRQPREPLRSARGSRARMIPAEQVVQGGWQKNWADIGVPNPKGYRICMCHLYRPIPGLISVA